MGMTRPARGGQVGCDEPASGVKLKLRDAGFLVSSQWLADWKVVNRVRGMTKKSASAVRAVTSDPLVAGRYFKYQSYKLDRHGCDSAIFNYIIFAFHRPTLTQS